MKIIKLKEIDSTHRYIKDYILENSYSEPLCVFCDFQTQGIGSRGNSWIGKEGNIFSLLLLIKNFCLMIYLYKVAQYIFLIF